MILRLEYNIHAFTDSQYVLCGYVLYAFEMQLLLIILKL